MKWYGKDKEEKLKNKTEFVSFPISKSKISALTRTEWDRPLLAE